MYSVEEELIGIFKQNGFIIAADLFDFRGITKKAVRKMIDSWKDYPKCMEIYPTKLSPKSYDESTTQYVRI